MEDPILRQENGDGDADAHAAGSSAEDDRRRRRRQLLAEEEMERLMMAQEEEEEDQDLGDNGDDDDDDDFGFADDNEDNDDGGEEFDENDGNNNGIGFLPDQLPAAAAALRGAGGFSPPPRQLSYIQASFGAALGLVYYAYRSRQQWYLAIIFLTSSKWAYIVMGNSLVASLIWTFKLFTNFFLDGLRLSEVEGIADFFRWNITETCLALTIFRSELDVRTAIMFLVFVLAKCLHWVAEQRESHFRMTEEMIVVRPGSSWPVIRWPHVKLLICFLILQFVDILAVVECGKDILENGPTVAILFAFESAIMLTSAVSCILLWNLHLIDGIFNYLHETTAPTNPAHRWVHLWHEYKATLIFAVEVQAQVVKFMSYITFFAIVMTYYGLPINLIREVYISFQVLKQRLVAFAKYRSLMAGMNRFANPTEEQLEEERTCIICRDEMTVETARRLPGCGHIFHKSCLREWLVQQQTCPTCRGDIASMEARQRQADLNNAAVEAREAGQQEGNEAAQQHHHEDEAQQEDQTPTNASSPPSNETDGQNSSMMHGHSNEGIVDRPSGPHSSDTAPSPPHISNDNEDNDMDRKLPASAPSSSPAISPNSSKRVRIIDPILNHQSGVRESSSDDGKAAFPAFYRVVHDDGASVYNDGDAVSFVIRIVPYGVVLIGQELSWRDCDGEKMMMIRIPDGWICEDALERIVAVPFDS